MKNELKKCKFCGEEIKTEAVKCRFCGEWLEKSNGVDDASEKERSSEYECSKCGADISTDDKVCPKCGEDVRKEVNDDIPIQLDTVPKNGKKKPVIKEYRRKCNACGKVWHSLAMREELLKNDAWCEMCGMCGTCGDRSAQAQHSRNIDSRQDELYKLHVCPNCGAKNYTEEILLHEQQ